MRFLVILLLLNVSYAGSVYVDGVKQNYSFSEAEFNQDGNLIIKTNSVNGGGASQPPTSSNGACQTRFPGVRVVKESAIFDWRRPQSQTGMNISQNDIHAYPFTTTSNPEYSGQLSVIYFSNSGRVIKDFWFSECPGGSPVIASSSGICEKTSQQADLYWQQSQIDAYRCTLKENHRYFFNIRNVPGSCTVSSGCGSKVQHITNLKP